jgi:Domain of unknown function (DUF4167)
MWETTPLNNNRGNNNNRRRGRGNRPQGGSGGGGGQQLNRIDSRARGNAPQLLEKYRKLAHDAHLNGDRVQAEYFLQFADHYFRVLADGRQRQEEQRLRRDDRWEGGAEEAEEAGEFTVENDFPSYDQANFSRPQRDDRPPREDRPQRAPRQAQDDREDRPQRAPRQAQDDREDRPRRTEREDEAPRAPQETQDERFAESETADQGEALANPYEPPENPFVRDNRTRGGLRPRREDRRPRRDEPNGESEAAEPTGLDPASLPPSISVVRDDSVEEAEAKPRRGRPRKKPSADDAGEALESVS